MKPTTIYLTSRPRKRTDRCCCRGEHADQ
jgi:hypothetical protein